MCLTPLVVWGFYWEMLPWLLIQRHCCHTAGLPRKIATLGCSCSSALAAKVLGLKLLGGGKEPWKAMFPLDQLGDHMWAFSRADYRIAIYA